MDIFRVASLNPFVNDKLLRLFILFQTPVLLKQELFYCTTSERVNIYSNCPDQFGEVFYEYHHHDIRLVPLSEITKVNIGSNLNFVLQTTLNAASANDIYRQNQYATMVHQLLLEFVPSVELNFPCISSLMIVFIRSLHGPPFAERASNWQSNNILFYSLQGQWFWEERIEPYKSICYLTFSFIILLDRGSPC